MRIAMLIDDSFGGRGGIAQFNRDLISSCSSDKLCDNLVIFQRIGRRDNRPEFVPPSVEYAYLPNNHRYGKDVSIRYSIYLASHLIRDRNFDLIICGQIYLLPLGYLMATMAHAQLVTIMHGVEAWSTTRHRVADWLARRSRNFISVSGYTRDRFVGWSGNRDARFFILPNTVDLDRFAAPVCVESLRHRLGLAGKRVMFTLGRLSAHERYKGHDELIELMPSLAAIFPDLVYMIGGEGDDRPRLAAKAAALGVADRVFFVGYVEEADKVKFFRLADLFLLAGRGEGFGIVLLEAMATGCPVIASCHDGSAEAVGFGKLGDVVDPSDPVELYGAIRRALTRERSFRPPSGLERFSHAAFRSRVSAMLTALGKPGDNATHISRSGGRDAIRQGSDLSPSDTA